MPISHPSCHNNYLPHPKLTYAIPHLLAASARLFRKQEVFRCTVENSFFGCRLQLSDEPISRLKYYNVENSHPFSGLYVNKILDLTIVGHKIIEKRKQFNAKPLFFEALTVQGTQSSASFQQALNSLEP